MTVVIRAATRATFTFLLLAVLSLLGCTQQDDPGAEKEHQAFVQKVIPPKKDADARRFIELIRIGDYGHAMQMAGPPLQVPNAPDMLRLLHEQINNQGAPLEIAPIGYKTGTSTYARQEVSWDAITYQLHSKGRYYLAWVDLDSAPDSDAILGINLRYHNGYESEVEFNRFTFTGRGWRDWAALILCAGTPIFIIAVTAICAFSPVRRKWLWILFIVLGIVQYQYDWTLGFVEVQPISVLLLGAGYLRESIYGPLTLQWAIPVGAFVFLIFRRKLIEARTREERPSSKKRQK